MDLFQFSSICQNREAFYCIFIILLFYYFYFFIFYYFYFLMIQIHKEIMAHKPASEKNEDFGSLHKFAEVSQEMRDVKEGGEKTI